MDSLVDQIDIGICIFTQPQKHTHGLSGSRGFIEQGGIGHGKTRKVDNQLLKIHKRLKPTLGDFGLIGRVGRVPARVLEKAALDGLGGDAAVVACTNVASVNLIFLCKGFKALERLLLGGGGRQIQRSTKTNGLGHSLVNKGIQ